MQNAMFLQQLFYLFINNFQFIIASDYFYIIASFDPNFINITFNKSETEYLFSRK